MAIYSQVLSYITVVKLLPLYSRTIHWICYISVTFNRFMCISNYIFPSISVWKGVEIWPFQILESHLYTVFPNLWKANEIMWKYGISNIFPKTENSWKSIHFLQCRLYTYSYTAKSEV